MSDGCTFFPDTSANHSCCVRHDRDYENKTPKVRADIKLAYCVAHSDKWYSGAMALVMLTGVTLFGWFSYYIKPLIAKWQR